MGAWSAWGHGRMGTWGHGDMGHGECPAAAPRSLSHPMSPSLSPCPCPYFPGLGLRGRCGRRDLRVPGSAVAGGAGDLASLPPFAQILELLVELVRRAHHQPRDFVALLRRIGEVIGGPGLPDLALVTEDAVDIQRRVAVFISVMTSSGPIVLGRISTLTSLSGFQSSMAGSEGCCGGGAACGGGASCAAARWATAASSAQAIKAVNVCRKKSIVAPPTGWTRAGRIAMRPYNRTWPLLPSSSISTA